MSIVENLKEKIRSRIIDSLEANKEAGNLQYNQIPDFVIEVPREKAHGDFATNVSMLMAKRS